MKPSPKGGSWLMWHRLTPGRIHLRLLPRPAAPHEDIMKGAAPTLLLQGGHADEVLLPPRCTAVCAGIK